MDGGGVLLEGAQPVETGAKGRHGVVVGQPMSKMPIERFMKLIVFTYSLDGCVGSSLSVGATDSMLSAYLFALYDTEAMDMSLAGADSLYRASQELCIQLRIACTDIHPPQHSARERCGGDRAGTGARARAQVGEEAGRREGRGWRGRGGGLSGRQRRWPGLCAVFGGGAAAAASAAGAAALRHVRLAATTVVRFTGGQSWDRQDCLQLAGFSPAGEIAFSTLSPADEPRQVCSGCKRSG